MIKKHILVILALVAAAQPALGAPNFIVILGEAQGWASMSEPLDDRNPQGSKSDFIRTPHLDSIARAGMRFSDFYASSPRCTPTRAALVTGKSPAQLHMTFVNEGRKDALVNPGDKVIAPGNLTELPGEIATLGTLLKPLGYATAHFGKWHLGRRNPKEHGFDENDGANSNGGPENVAEPNPKQCYEIAKLGIDFISRQVNAKKPFYLQLSQYPCRGPEAASPETIAAVKRRLGTRMDFFRIGTAAGAEEIDQSIGLVLAKLKELGADENTYIIYTADHGAQGRDANGILSNGKGTVWEGGIRVPLLIAGPGIKAGVFCHERASTVDLFPTVAQFAGAKAAMLPKGLEGGSLASLLTQGGTGAVARMREELVIHFPHYDKDEWGPASAILLREYKLIHFYEGGQKRLFDLRLDPSERHDLSATKPEVATALDKRLADYLAGVNAGLPQPNPNYDAKGERSGDRRGGKGGEGKGKKGMRAEPSSSSATSSN